MYTQHSGLEEGVHVDYWSDAHGVGDVDWLAFSHGSKRSKRPSGRPLARSQVGLRSALARVTEPDRFEKTTLAWLIVYRLAVFIFLAMFDMLHRNRFTYWCYGLETGFYLALGLGYALRNRFAPRVLAVFVSPMVFGNVFMVSFLITLILLGDRGLLFEEATQVANVGIVHFANVIVHMLTLFDFFVLLVAGYKEALHAEMHRWLSFLAGKSPGLPRMYQVIFVLLPASYMLAYVLCWDPFDEYPTPYLDPWILIVIALVVGYGAMIWFWHACTIAHKPRLRSVRGGSLSHAQGDSASDSRGEDWE